MTQQYYIKGTNEAIFVEEKAFASGGEGSLFNIQSPSHYTNYVAKIFHPNKRNDQQREEKINYLIANRPKFEYGAQSQSVIWLEKALYDDDNKFIGFIMPKATGEKLEVLCAPKLPKRLGSAWQRLVFGHEDAMRLRMKVCYNIAVAVRQIHATGKYVLVDLKPDNILIQSNGLISIVDIDSIEVVENGQTKFPATVATPEYTPAEYYEGVRPGEVPIDKSWDEFSLAVIFYRLLLGIHPFAASAVPPYDNLVSLGDKIHHGLYVHQDNKAIFSIIPPPHKRFDDLDEDIQQLFNQTFIEGHKQSNDRISAELWAAGFVNSPLLLIDRPLPSKVLNVNNSLKQNWYELAVSKAIKELNLTLPLQRQQATTLLAQTSVKSFRKKVSKQYLHVGKVIFNLAKFAGVVTLIIIVFVFFIGLFSGDFSISIAFEVFSHLLMSIFWIIWWIIRQPIFIIAVLLPLILTIGNSVGSFLITQVGKMFKQFQESVAVSKGQRLRYLEDKQYGLFTRRVKLKKRLQELKTELGILKQVKSKKEDNFQKKYGEKVQETNKLIQTDLSKETYQIQLQDQKARELMRQEAYEIKQLRVNLLEKLQSTAPYNEILGNSPEQKINNLAIWKQQQTGVEQEIDKLAVQIQLELELMQKDLKEKIATIQTQFDQAHEDLVKQGKDFKTKIDHIIESASQKIRIESELDTKLLDKSYKKVLKTRNDLILTLYEEEAKLDELNDQIRLVRGELSRFK